MSESLVFLRRWSTHLYVKIILFPFNKVKLGIFNWIETCSISICYWGEGEVYLKKITREREEVFVAAPNFAISLFCLSYIKPYLPVICILLFFLLLADTSKYVGK